MFTYQDWSRPYGRPKGPPLTDATAQSRYSDGERVMVLFGDPSQPDMVLRLELGGRLIDATWLDRLMRPTTTYIWGQPEDMMDWPPDSLLLEQVVLSEHDHEDRPPRASVSRGEAHFFKRNGDCSGQKVDYQANTKHTTSGHEPGAVQTETIPHFGRWDPFFTSIEVE